MNGVVLFTINKDNNNCPLLSVVMPVHNTHRYLSICLDSILNQTEPNYEIIAIDDASEDNSYKILKEYEKKDARLSVYKNEYSLGAAQTRNKGLDLSRGKFIIFLDSDDYFERDFFKKMLDAINYHNADIAICDILRRDEKTGNEYVYNKNSKLMSKLLHSSFHPDEHNCLIFYDMPLVPFNKLLRRSFIIEKKIRFQNLPNSNDIFFGIMSTVEAEKVVYVPYPLVHYRYNTGCQISTSRHKDPLCVCYAYIKIREELISKNLWPRFKRMYYDLAISSIFWTVWSISRTSDVQKYIQSEVGCNKLGFNNLIRDDFFYYRNYGKYVCLFTDNLNIHSFRSILLYSIRCFIFLKNASSLYVLSGKLFLCFLHKIKKIIQMNFNDK